MAKTASLTGCVIVAGILLNLPIDEARADTIVLPTFDVVAATPLGGAEIDVARYPGAVWQTGAEEIRTFNDTTVTDTLARRAPGVTVGNVSGNDFEPDVSYRGFDATPVTGAPIGLAVYQNGVRINEAFGDTVNWDLIPENAIDKMTIVAGNPIFGLNALGGALNVTMKNGFTWQGFEADLRGGSFYRAQEELQFGKQVGDWSIYIAGTEINDGGWRVDGASQLTNVYGDVGYRANGFESHLQLTAGNTQFGAGSSTPLQELQTNWRSVYTVPQTTDNQMAMLAWTGSYAYSNTLSFQGGLYFRSFNQSHVDGNSTGVYACPPYSCLNGGPVHDTLGGLIPDISQNGTIDLGENDRNWTQSRSLGGSGQAVDTDKIYGHDNAFTVGASLDYGWTNFTGDSQLGVVPGFINNSLPIVGSPYIIDEPLSYLAPVAVKANNTYVGVYALDAFNPTDRLALTAGARFNFAGIDLSGENGAFTNGYSTFVHVNPTVGLTYKITPDINLYAGYAMTNRAPTPLELGCADPNNPCIINNFLSSDPALKQVVGQTLEAGLRGEDALGPWGKLRWSAGLVPHHARQRHPAAAEPAERLRILRQCRNDAATGRRAQRPMERRPVDRLRELQLYRRRLSHDVPGAVAVQPRRECDRPHPDHQRRADRRHSQEHRQGRLRLRRDPELEDRRRHGRSLGPGDLRRRERRVAAIAGLCGVRRAHVLPVRQAIADLWPHSEHF